MNQIQRERKYGKPSPADKPYFPDIYCCMCNKIPVIDTWDRSTGKIVGVEITSLFPVETKLGFTPDAPVVEMMICLGCIDRIEAKMRAEIKRRFGIGQGPYRGPDGLTGGQGGGIGVRPM